MLPAPDRPASAFAPPSESSSGQVVKLPLLRRSSVAQQGRFISSHRRVLIPAKSAGCQNAIHYPHPPEQSDSRSNEATEGPTPLSMSSNRDRQTARQSSEGPDSLDRIDEQIPYENMPPEYIMFTKSEELSPHRAAHHKTRRFLERANTSLTSLYFESSHFGNHVVVLPKVIDTGKPKKIILGRGAFGIAYLGFDISTETFVAIKCLRVAEGDKRGNAAASRESRAGEKTGHIKGEIIRNSRKHSTTRRPVNKVYFLQELGLDSMKNVIKFLMRNWQTDLSFPTSEQESKTFPGYLVFTAFLIKTLKEITKLHQRQLLHRDLKPDNLVLAKKGVRPIDFGTSLRVGSKMKHYAGTHHYMSPEVQALSFDDSQESYFKMHLPRIIRNALIFEIDNRPHLAQNKEMYLEVFDLWMETLKNEPKETFLTRFQEIRLSEPTADPEHHQEINALMQSLSEKYSRFTTFPVGASPAQDLYAIGQTMLRTLFTGNRAALAGCEELKNDLLNQGCVEDLRAGNPLPNFNGLSLREFLETSRLFQVLPDELKDVFENTILHLLCPYDTEEPGNNLSAENIRQFMRCPYVLDALNGLNPTTFGEELHQIMKNTGESA